MRFEEDVHCILLPKTPRRDPHSFLREELSVETRKNLLQEGLEVQQCAPYGSTPNVRCSRQSLAHLRPLVLQVRQIGSDTPANCLWPRDRPLKPGTYRVIIKSTPKAGAAATSA